MSELKLQKAYLPVSDTKASLQIKINNEWCTLKEQEGYFFSKEELKKFATDFYFYWHNHNGNNTYEGYDDYIKQLNL